MRPSVHPLLNLSTDRGELFRQESLGQVWGTHALGLAEKCTLNQESGRTWWKSV